MILLGAGVNHWYHSDQIYRAILLLTTITGTQGRNGGGWAHYVGQEKIRPIMGFQHLAFALDWHRPPRHMNQTAYWYVNTSQYRYDTFSADDLAAEHEGKQITFADTQAAPVPVITSPEWSGSETGGRRYSPFTINVERLKPWHTLTGRQHFYLDHDWMSELGENLPVYRPPLNMGALFAEPDVGTTGELGVTVRYLTPHNKWSIHSEYQDNLFMLSLSRGGQTIWMSDRDAAKVGVEDNDWIEAVNRNGVVVARAIVSHRMPEGTVYMHHAQDRLIDVPIAETSGKRGGIHNSLTRILVKPSHVIGGYAQLAFAFNYLGPTGNQRDEVTVIRKRSQEVTY